jgi:hypothetical protein
MYHIDVHISWRPVICLGMYPFDSDAFELAKAIEYGIRSNPMVWETVIAGIIRVDMERP